MTDHIWLDSSHFLGYFGLFIRIFGADQLDLRLLRHVSHLFLAKVKQSQPHPTEYKRVRGVSLPKRGCTVHCRAPCSARQRKCQL